jgi:hypothetical protein
VTADTRPIVFGPGDKLQWLEAIANDRRAQPFDVRLAVGISNRIDKHIGTATIGQIWLATFIGGTDRGVRKSGDRLAALGHLTIDRSETCRADAVRRSFGGRGKANVYRPIKPQKTRNSGSGFSSQNPERPFLVYDGKTRNGATLNPEQRSTKPGTVVPPLPNTYQNSSYPGAIEASDPNTDRWLAVKRGLERRIGTDVVAGWFNKLTVSSITPREVVLIAPNKFIRHTIEGGTLGARLEEEWKLHVPTIERVRLIDPVLRAAE